MHNIKKLVHKLDGFLQWRGILLVLLFFLTACGQYTPASSLPAKPGEVAGQNAANQLGQPVSRIHLPVEHISQLPELPNGCEATALTIVLNYYGFQADKMDIAYNVIPRQSITAPNGRRTGPYPGEVYSGDPGAGQEGYYCYPKVVITAAQTYLNQQGVAEKYALQDITGADKAELELLLSNGIPLLVWTAKEFAAQPVYSQNGWYLPGGEFYRPYANLHCLVLIGFTGEQYVLTDPLSGDAYTVIDKNVFMESFNAMGSFAVSVSEIPT